MPETSSDPPFPVPSWATALFDRLPDVVFFLKDSRGRYVAVNDTLVRRLGVANKDDLIGRTAAEVFPPPLGERYSRQDRAVCRTGRPLEDVLELHLYPHHREGWCITHKLPLRDEHGTVIGLAGVSRDAQYALPGHESLADLADAVQRIHAEFEAPLTVAELAATARLSVYQFNRRIRALFGLTPAQLITRVRTDAARAMLVEGSRSLTDIALACGYCDQSAFTRIFRATVGLTPGQYRSSHSRTRQ